jgi:hypothetical protein
MPTQQVQTIINGTTLSINVSAMNLSQDLASKDFIVIIGGNVVPNTNYTKTSTTSITYTGPSLVSESVILRRKTPAVQKHVISYSRRISSNDWSDEVDRLYRRLEEVEAFGYNYLGGFIGAGNTVVNNQPYGSDWSTDTQGVSSRQAVYNKFASVDAAIQTNVNNITTVGTLVTNLSGTVNNQAVTIGNLSTTLSVTQTNVNTLTNRVTTLESTANVRPVFTVRRISTQTLVQNTPTTIVFTNELDDPSNLYNNGTGDFAVPVGGVYEAVFSGNVGATSGLNGYTTVSVLNVTDSTSETIGYLMGLSANASAGSIVYPLLLLSGKTYRLQITTAGVSPTVVADSTRPMVFSLKRLS